MTQNSPAEPWPSELRLNPEKTMLRVAFGDGVSQSLPAELLRVASPSAEVRGHSPEERKLVAGKRKVFIREIEPIGNYAVKLVFSDGHDTGLFTWSYLYRMAQEKEEMWNGYLKEIAAAGLSRDPR
ncbi:MAG: gamma-butyrobetaine hydroxylase-like domain-containing protein [Rhodomicrobium sp.]